MVVHYFCYVLGIGMLYCISDSFLFVCYFRRIKILASINKAKKQKQLMTKATEDKDEAKQNAASDAIKQMEKVMFDLPTALQDSADQKTTKKPCRACVDFKSWTKNMTGTSTKVWYG